MERMISGIKPSGKLTLGNYLGAIKQFIEYQNDYDLFVFIADLHALTVYQDPAELRENTKNLIAAYLAAGLDPEKVTLFKQSDIPEHNQLEWIITCNTELPDMTKMPQYKNYQEKYTNKAMPAALLLYPNLMSSDILLYDASKVPVGQDQMSHIFLTRLQAETFNKLYGETFVIPEGIVAKTGAKIMSLSNPMKKMSKSESDTGTIYILDDEQSIRNKIKKAKTDGEFKIYYDPINKPGISNLLAIYSCLSGKSAEDLEKQYENISNYGVFKNDLADIVWAELSKLQSKITEIKTSGIIDKVLKDGADRARKVASNKISEVYKKIGIS